MVIYIVRRLLIALLTLWVVTILVYVLMRSVPGDPFAVDLEGDKKVNPDDIKRAKAALGLDDDPEKTKIENYFIGYKKWFSHVLEGDFGLLIRSNRDVTKIIKETIGPTLRLTVTSFALAYLLAIPMGLYCSAHSGSMRERSISTSLYMLYSLPAFVAAMFLQSYFSVKLKGTWFELPLSNMRSDNYESMTTLQQTWDHMQHLFLPVLCYTYGILAYDCRFIQANMAEVTKQDYIRTARAKGVSEFSVYTKHAFRNTLIPFVTLIGLTLPALLSGSVILETIFNWPGMGRQLIEAVRMLEYFLVMAIVLLYASLALLGQLLADVLYAIVDPRITYD
jgi:peptide/nickel transport system permease protein